MAIPDYQSCMLPLLTFASDGQEHHIVEAVEKLSDQFKLTQALILLKTFKTDHSGHHTLRFTRQSSDAKFLAIHREYIHGT